MDDRPRVAVAPPIDAVARTCVRVLVATGFDVSQNGFDPDAVLVATAEAFADLPATGRPDKIVVVGEFRTAPAIRKALGQGANGIVRIADLETVLGPTVAAVEAGQLAIPRDVRGPIARPSLSTREKQTLAMVVIGCSNGEIARKLFVTESTVKAHLSSSFRKLGVRSRNEATRLILDPEHGLGTGILAITDGQHAASPSGEPS